ncbi:hypothetical protein [Kineococcus sp. R86509]|uniref:hypothetical protein n=1 Tax=Kineococcus sp. R86509 TaxID=3093851 RepID=UPI0036D38298
MKVGKGYNLLTGDALPSPAVTGTLSPVQMSGGQQVVSQIRRIEDLETLHTSLGVSVDAGGSYMGFSASAKVDFVGESNFTQYSTYLLVKVSVSNAVLTFDDPVLTDEAVLLVQNGDSPRFRERFGDCFFSGIVRGGEYFAIVEISGSDVKEREETAVAIEAAYDGLVASASLSVDIKTKKEHSKSNLNVSINVFQQGSVSTTDQDIGSIMAKAKGFPPSVAGDLAYPYALVIEEYRALRLPSDAFNPLDIENQRQVLLDLARRRFEFITLQNDIRHVLTSPEDFTDPDVAALKASYDEVVAAVNQMQKEASACTRDPGRCQFTVFDTSKFPLPDLRPGAPVPTTVTAPALVGQTLAWAQATCTRLGLGVDQYPTSGPDDHSDGVAWQEVLSDWTDQDGVFHSRIGEEHVRVTWQQQPAGTDVSAGSNMIITIDPA